MKYIIIILLIIIVILFIHLFFIKRELHNLSLKINQIKNSDSNNLIHNDYGVKEINDLINQINNLLIDSRKNKVIYLNKSNSLTKMMMNISHDLRTPLTSASGYIDIILKSNISETEKIHELNIIKRKLKRLEELIESFFEFSQIVSNDKSPNIEKLNLSSILEESIANYYDDFVSSNKEIEYIVHKNKIFINSNKRMLSRIFDNLIANAYKHGDGNLKIEVQENKNIKIIFENKIKNKDLDVNKMFDEFYTTDISRTKGNTGLGLAIAKEFTEQLKGKIYASQKDDILKITLELN